MSYPSEYTKITLAERPGKGPINDKTFKIEKGSFDELVKSLESSQVLVQNNWISLDPAMRGWLNDSRSYVPPVGIGQVMRAGTISTVVKIGEGVKSVKVGDVVSTGGRWAEYAIVPEKDVTPISPPPGAEILDFLGPLGMTGLTAYFGLLDIGQPKEGETLVVTGAAGATGSVVCQLGKILGMKVIAIAGTDDKCKWLEEELNVDKAINYKSPTFYEDVKKHVGYLDVLFENVGGDILNMLLGRLKQNARIVLCGAISQYNQASEKGLTNYTALIGQRALMKGFIVFDYAARFQEARERLSTWIAEGKIKRRYHVVEGIEKCPEALKLLYEGGNNGKLVVKVETQSPKL